MEEGWPRARRVPRGTIASRTLSLGKRGLLYYRSRGGGAGSVVFRSFAPFDPIGGHDPGLALERQGLEGGHRRRRSESRVERLGDENLPRPRFGAQAGGNVDGVTDHRVLQPAVAADVAGKDVADVEADSRRPRPAPLALAFCV